MTDFPGFPSGGFDFTYDEVGAALAGLVVRDADGAPRSGVLSPLPALVTAGAGWTVEVAPLVVVRADGRKVLIGGCDEVSALPIEVAPSANARIDVVYSLPANVDAGDPVAGVAVRTGTPGAVPAKPSIPVGAVELGTVRVNAGVSGAAGAVITETFPSTCTAGGVLPFRTVALMNAFNAISGQLASVGPVVYVRRGAEWKALIADPAGWNSVSVPNSTPSGTSLQWQEVGGFIELVGRVQFTAGFTGTRATAFTLPLAARPEADALCGVKEFAGTSNASGIAKSGGAVEIHNDSSIARNVYLIQGRWPARS